METSAYLHLGFIGLDSLCGAPGTQVVQGQAARMKMAGIVLEQQSETPSVDR